MVVVLQIVAALASVILAMMAAKDAQTAREHDRPIAFVVFALLAMLFAASFVWVLFI